MSFKNSEAAALLTAAILSQHKIAMTVEDAEKVAVFHKHLVFFLDLHLPEAGAPSAGGARPGGR